MVKRVSDYLDKLQEMYPELSKKDIERMVNYGWRMFYFYSLRGCDIITANSKASKWMYCGSLCIDPIKHFNYYRRKLRRKIRVLWALKKREWDGYYYTAITPEEYEQIKYTFGRPKTNLTVHNKVLFKIKNEAFVYYHTAKYFIRCKLPIDYDYTIYKETCKCKDVKLILDRERPLTLDDLIKISNDEKRNN